MKDNLYIIGIDLILVMVALVFDVVDVTVAVVVDIDVNDDFLDNNLNNLINKIYNININVDDNDEGIISQRILIVAIHIKVVKILVVI